MDEDWRVFMSFLPATWKELARSSGALKGLRQDKSPENLLRILLLHVACGYSLRETATRARLAGIANLSDVALLKRLRKSQQWLHLLCVELFKERTQGMFDTGGLEIRLFDGSIVKEPGKTGSQWRIHYSVRLPTLTCDFFRITATEGKGTGESLLQFPLSAGDYILADRGYSTATGIHHIARHGGFLGVRLNVSSVVLLEPDGRPFNMVDRLRPLTESGEVSSWPVLVPEGDSDSVSARVCVIRKTQEAIRQAQEKLRRKASKKGQELKPETLIYAEYVIVLTTFPAATFTAAMVLDYYRIRWQIELVFKRFKQIAQLGHLPKHDDDSAKSWLYGKLVAALLTEKLVTHASSISPWGCTIAETMPPGKVV